MRYQDTLYGEFHITESVLIELISSPALKRLKGIDPGAYRKPFFPGVPPSRFDHSIGVMLLLKKYRAPLEEQVAGLIHDVSHSAFSHGIDYILKRGTEKTQAHQDNIHHDFIKQSGIPAILSRHGFDLAYILDDSHFPLKETDIPDICADRLDYTFRDAVSYGELTATEVFEYLDHLHAENGFLAISSMRNGLPNFFICSMTNTGPAFVRQQCFKLSVITSVMHWRKNTSRNTISLRRIRKYLIELHRIMFMMNTLSSFGIV